MFCSFLDRQTRSRGCQQSSSISTAAAVVASNEMKYWNCLKSENCTSKSDPTASGVHNAKLKRCHTIFIGLQFETWNNRFSWRHIKRVGTDKGLFNSCLYSESHYTVYNLWLIRDMHIRHTNPIGWLELGQFVWLMGDRQLALTPFDWLVLSTNSVRLSAPWLLSVFLYLHIILYLRYISYSSFNVWWCMFAKANINKTN